MADSTDPGRHKDPTIDAGASSSAEGHGADVGKDVPPIPAVRRRHAHEQKTTENVEQETKQLETSTVTRTYMKTITTSLTTSSSSLEHLETPPHRLREKVAQYEKVWSDGSGKRPAELGTDELRQQQTDDYDAENPFDIDVHEIERRLREERQRGLAEAEAAKLAFQQVHLRQTTPTPRRVEVTSEQTPSPFNVTLKTTSRLSPGAELGNVEEQLSPFNVTLRTTRRTVKKDLSRQMELERFLDGERTVREVQAADGVRTIITSSRTSDGGYTDEKIYRHGEGYVSPRDSPSWSRSSISSERSSVTSPHSVDMTAGGRRILIKLEDELEPQASGAAGCEHGEQRDETDGSVRARIRQFGGQDEDAMATGNIDITVGSNPRRRQRLYQQTTLPVGGNGTTPQQQQEREWEREQEQKQQQRATRPSELSWQTGKSTTKTMLTSTPTGTKEQPQMATPDEIFSPAATCQLRGSSTEESRQIVSHKTITSTKTTTTTTQSSDRSERKSSTSRKSIGFNSPSPSGNISFTASQIRIRDDVNVDVDADVIDNDSDTEGVPASSLVIVSTPTRSTTPSSAHALSGIGTFSKSLRQDYQTQATQSNRHNESEHEYQEFQSTMASINFARSNSQYDSHIKEKRGKLDRHSF